MIKGKKALLIVGVIVVVGFGSFIGYQKFMEAHATEKVQEHVQKVYALEDVTRVEYKANELITLEKQGENWANLEFPNLSYDQNLVINWINGLQTLETKEVVKNVQDESVYGISDESVMITLYDNMNNCETIQLGNIVAAEDSIYIKEGSEDVLYVLSYEKTKDIFTNPNNFVDCSQVLQLPELQSIVIESTSDCVQLVRDEQWYLKDYYAVPGFLKEDTMEDLMTTIESMKIENYIGTYDALDAYGLEQPRLILTLNDSVKMAFGNTNGKTVYVRVNDGQEVYTVDESLYATMAGFKPFNAMDRQVMHLGMNQIDTITLVNPQGTYELKFKKTDEVSTEENLNNDEVSTEENLNNDKVSAEENLNNDEVKDDNVKNEETISVEPIVATLNEKELTDEEAQKWLEKIEASLYIQAQLQNPNIEQKEERKAEATMSYKFKDGSTCEIELIPYDINYYILRYNGKIEFAVNKEKVTKVFNELTYFTKE